MQTVAVESRDGDVEVVRQARFKGSIQFQLGEVLLQT